MGCLKGQEERHLLDGESGRCIRQYAVGQRFVTGIAKHYDDAFPPALEGILSREAFDQAMHRINATMCDYWPCGLVFWGGLLAAPFTLGLSLLAPRLCVNSVRARRAPAACFGLDGASSHRAPPGADAGGAPAPIPRRALVRRAPAAKGAARRIYPRQTAPALDPFPFSHPGAAARAPVAVRGVRAAGDPSHQRKTGDAGGRRELGAAPGLLHVLGAWRRTRQRDPWSLGLVGRDGVMGGCRPHLALALPSRTLIGCPGAPSPQVEVRY